MSDKKRLVCDCGKTKDHDIGIEIMQLSLLCGLSPVLSVQQVIIPQGKHCPSITCACVQNSS